MAIALMPRPNGGVQPLRARHNKRVKNRTISREAVGWNEVFGGNCKSPSLLSIWLGYDLHCNGRLSGTRIARMVSELKLC